jgi:predicted CoA-binding protein
MSDARVVVVLGASPKPDRFAFRALRMLLDRGVRAAPVNPAFPEILGQRCHASIADVPGPIDTVTMYLGARRSDPLIEEIIAAKPRRIIFNPGSENERLEKIAREHGVEVLRDCTLVMLQSGTF